MGQRGTNRNRQVLTKFPRDGVATVADAAVFLKCGVTTVYKMINEGTIKTCEVGNGEKRIAWWFLRQFIGEPMKQ